MNRPYARRTESSPNPQLLHQLVALALGRQVAVTHDEPRADGADADYLKQIEYSGYLVAELAYEKGTKVTRSLDKDLRLSRLYAEKVFPLTSG